MKRIHTQLNVKRKYSVSTNSSASANKQIKNSLDSSSNLSTIRSIQTVTFPFSLIDLIFFLKWIRNLIQRHHLKTVSSRSRVTVMWNLRKKRQQICKIASITILFLLFTIVVKNKHAIAIWLKLNWILHDFMHLQQ